MITGYTKYINSTKVLGKAIGGIYMGAQTTYTPTCNNGGGVTSVVIIGD